MPERFVVTGTGRSGTRWASEVLGVGHQAIFTGDGVHDVPLATNESPVIGDCSFWAASQDLTGWRVVLLVRDPRYVVASWWETGEFYQMLGKGYHRLWQHCKRIDPYITRVNLTTRERLEAYWASVNHIMAERADVILRLEDTTPEALADACGEVPFQDVPPSRSITEPIEIEETYTRRVAEEFGYDC